MKKTLLVLSTLVTFVHPVLADDSSAHWVFRGSIANVSPNDSSGAVLGNDGVTVGSATATGLSLTYQFDQHWGVEVLAATPFTHSIDGTGALQGIAIGETKQLPPTVSAIYQWGDVTKFHAGVGINHTVFFDSHTDNALTSALSADTTDIDLDSSTGLAMKLGFDTPISADWRFSGSVYYINIDTQADVIVNGAVATTVDVNIDPWVYMLGFSKVF